MDAAAARNFDRTRNFDAYWTSDPVGAAYWCTQVLEGALSESTDLAFVCQLLRVRPAPEEEPKLRERLQEFRAPLVTLGRVLATGPGCREAAQALGVRYPAHLPTPFLVGTIRLEPADPELRSVTRGGKAPTPLQRQVTFECGGRRFILTCPNEPLEAFGGDLSVFEGAFRVAIRGWSAGGAKILVEEACPLLALEGLTERDWAHGRLYDGGIKDGPLTLRVNSSVQVLIADERANAALRPWVGTAVCMYAKRTADPVTGITSLADVRPDLWVLCRLTDPEDKVANIAQAPDPLLQESGRCLFIGGTPPWNWQGPNVRTHILAPAVTRSLVKSTERRLVYGHILDRLPEGTKNHYEPVTRVFDASLVTERDTDTEAHWAARLAPIAGGPKDIGAFADLTLAAALVPEQ